MCSMRVGFSPSISSNSDSASGFATRGSTPLISPQPVMPWFVSIFTYTAGPTHVAFIFVILIDDDLSATLAAGLFSWPTASESIACPAANAPIAENTSRRVVIMGEAPEGVATPRAAYKSLAA